MSPDLPELPATHIRPAPAAQAVIHEGAAGEGAVAVPHDDQEVRAIDAVFADNKDEAASALLALWGASVILDGLIEDAKGQHGAGEPEEKGSGDEPQP